ncbi:MAG: ATP-binding protein [Akkermansiaceae bacterium]
MNYFAYACAIVFLVLFILARRKASAAEHTLAHLKKDTDELLKQAEVNQNKEIQHLLDALHHPFFSIDSKGIIIRCNNPAKQLFGTREILNRPVRQVFLDSPIISSLTQVLDSPEIYREKLRLPPTSVFSSKYVDKDSFWVMDLRPTSLGSDDTEFQLIMRDITPDVQSDQVRQDFVANASHELRTPLSIISGYLENLTEEGGLDDHAIAAKMLDTMVRHVTRINRIVEDMLVISRLESDDAAPLKLAPFRFAPCVQDIVERLDLVIAKQGARIVVDVPDIEVVGDQFYWTQILFNLVENALKQNPSIPLEVKIKASQDKDRNLTVRISDNGIGIPASDLPFIFKRFYRVAKHHSQTQIKGTGLGLSIVMRAVEAHKGKILASSTPGVKTTFTIETPPLKAS